MFKLLAKSIGVLGMCGCADVRMCGCAILTSISITKEDYSGSFQRVNTKSNLAKISEIKKIEDIDIWGQQNNCIFTFVESENSNSHKIHAAEGFINSKKELNTQISDWEQALIKGADDYKEYCDGDPKNLIFQYDSTNKKFHIDNLPPKDVADSILFLLLMRG